MTVYEIIYNGASYGFFLSYNKAFRTLKELFERTMKTFGKVFNQEEFESLIDDSYDMAIYTHEVDMDMSEE